MEMDATYVFPKFLNLVMEEKETYEILNGGWMQADVGLLIFG